MVPRPRARGLGPSGCSPGPCPQPCLPAPDRTVLCPGHTRSHLHFGPSADCWTVWLSVSIRGPFRSLLALPSLASRWGGFPGLEEEKLGPAGPPSLALASAGCLGRLCPHTPVSAPLGPSAACDRGLPRPRSTRPAPLLGAQTRAHPRRPSPRPPSTETPKEDALRQAVPGGGARLSPKAGIVPGAAAPAKQGHPASPRGRVLSPVLGRAAACVQGPRASLVSAVAMSQQRGCLCGDRSSRRERVSC